MSLPGHFPKKSKSELVGGIIQYWIYKHGHKGNWSYTSAESLAKADMEKRVVQVLFDDLQWR